MNILFLTMNNFDSIHEHSLYPDLIRELAARGHRVTVLSPVERKLGIETNRTLEGNIRSIKVRTGNLFDVGMAEKALSRAGVCGAYERALQRFCGGERFDLVLYSTPPTTLAPIVNKVKKQGAYAYLMLKDIFPQNAVDLGMFGQKSLAFRYFRRGEKRIYAASDTIGCMSPANEAFLKRQDPWIDPGKITVCPNAIEVRDIEMSEEDKRSVRRQYGIPEDKLLFVYGGGLGKPQGIDFLERCLRAAADDREIYFVVVGSGPYFESLQALSAEIPESLKVMRWLPTEEYEKIVRAGDVGLIMLNHAFRIPNFPSRLLLYMEARLPVLCATDPNTDVGRIARENGFGAWCESNDENAFLELLSRFKEKETRMTMGRASYAYLKEHYSVGTVADSILRRAEGSR